MKKIVFTLSILFILTLFSMSIILSPVLADDPIDGTFNSTGFNNPTEYTKFTIHELSAFGADNGSFVNDNHSLTPQQFYRFTLGVRDEDTLADIQSIQVHFYYREFDENALTNNQGTYAVLEWVSGTSEFVVTDASVSTTWVVSNSAIPGDFTEKEGVFSFDLQISKVARYTDDSEWQVGLVVVDGVVAEGYEPKAVSHAAIRVVDNDDPLAGDSSSFDMNWYGELDLTTQVALWTDVSPNLDFGDEGSQVTIPGIQYISNGSYDREIRASDFWNIVDDSGNPAEAADGSTRAALTTNITNVGFSDSSSVQQFALRVDQSPTLTEESDLLIPVGETETVAFAKDQTFTDEDGVVVNAYLWLALSSRFQNATYNGDIVLSIVNAQP